MRETMDAIIDLGPDPSSWHHESIIASYGAMKIGQQAAIIAYARLIAERVVATAQAATDSEELLVLSSPRGSTVPSASNLLARAVVGACREHDTRLSLELLEIRRRHRKAELPRHYSSLDQASRIDYLTRDRENWFVDADLRDRSVILINDICVTGSQQRQLAAFLRELGVRHSHFLYLARISPSADAHAAFLETTLNLVGVTNDAAFLDFLRCGDFSITTRLIWRLIELPAHAFKEAIGALNNSNRAAIVAGIRSEGSPSVALGTRLRLIESCLDQAEVRH